MRLRIKTNRIVARTGRVPPVSPRPIKESKLLTLPSEIVHNVLTFLEVSDLFVCMLICRQIKQIIDASVVLKYRIELFSEYLVEGDGSFGAAMEQLRHLEQCREAWLQLIPMKQEWVDFRALNAPDSRYIFDLHEGVWAYSRRPFGLNTITNAPANPTENNNTNDDSSNPNANLPPISIFFTELPASVTLRPPMEPRRLDIDLRFKELIMDVSQDLLILFVTSRPKGATVHLRTISDNSPHPEAESPMIQFPECSRIYKVAVCEDKIAVLSLYLEDDSATDGQTRWWNWKTGKLLGGINRGSCMVFLSSAYLAVLTYQAFGICFHILSSETFSVVRVGNMGLTEPICNLYFPDWVGAVDMSITAYESRLSTNKTYKDCGPNSHSDKKSTSASTPTSPLGRMRPYYADKDADLFAIHLEPINEKSFLIFFRKNTLLKRAIHLAHSFPNMKREFKWETWGPGISRWIYTPDSDLWSCNIYGLKFVCFSTVSYASDQWGHLLPKKDGPNGDNSVAEAGGPSGNRDEDGDWFKSSTSRSGHDLPTIRPPRLPVLNNPNAHINPIPIRSLNSMLSQPNPQWDINLYLNPNPISQTVPNDAMPAPPLHIGSNNMPGVLYPPSDSSDSEPPSPEPEEVPIKTHLLVLDFNPRPIARGANSREEPNPSNHANAPNRVNANRVNAPNTMKDASKVDDAEGANGKSRENDDDTSGGANPIDGISGISGGKSYSVDSADCYVVTEDSVYKDWFKHDVVSRMPFRAFASRMALPMTLDAVGIENENIILANFSDYYEHGELAGLLVLTF